MGQTRPVVVVRGAGRRRVFIYSTSLIKRQWSDMDILSPLFRKEHRVLLKISEMMDEARGKGGEARLALFKTAERYLGDHLDVMHEHTTDFARAYQVVGWELVPLSEGGGGVAG